MHLYFFPYVLPSLHFLSQLCTIFFSSSCYVLYAFCPNIINAFVFIPTCYVLYTSRPKIMYNFFFSHSCYVLFASRPKIIKAFVFIPYVLRSLHFSPQNYIFLPFVLRALCFCDFFMYIMRNENILIRIEN